MNKYIRNIVINSSIILAVALLLGSCSKILDKEPLDQISSNTFWKTQEDADMALAGVYERLDCSTFDYNQAMLDIMGGDAGESVSGQGGGQGYRLLAEGEILPTSGSIVSSIYSDCYKGISSCNFFLENIDKVPIGDDVKNKYKGEVRFLRALFYFKLTNFYGGVPLYTKTVTVEEAKVKQATKGEVIAQITNDLDFAVTNLPNVAYSGHAVRGSALALKAKVLLVNQQWSAAADVADSVIKGGIFHLSDNYKNLFLAIGQNDNPEIIFSTKYLNPDHSSDQDIRLAWHAILNPRQELVDAFGCTDGLPITSSHLYDPNDWKKNRDPRLVLTVRPFGEPAVNSAGVAEYFHENNISVSGWEPMKGINVDALPIDYSTKSEQDWILMRFAEVLLIYAEAKNEALSAPDASVYNAINAVRGRPGIDMPALPNGLTKDQMRERIRHERRVELAMEGKRYLDIKRWKTAETYIPTLIDEGGTSRAFDPAKNYLFPFPQSEIDVNPNLVQNPNY
jgi:hypothetical protein